MNVLYDYQAFSMQRYGGVSKCFCELIKSLSREIHSQILIEYSNNAHLWDTHLCDNLSRGFDYYSFLPDYSFKGKKRLYSYLNQLNIISDIDKKNLHFAIKNFNNCSFDVFHPTYYNPYFLDYIGEKPFVLTIHDMMPELFPQYYRSDDSQIVWKKCLASKANHIIAVSDNTKRDIVKLLNVEPNKISVVYHGGPEICLDNLPSLSYRPYFLFVGMRTGYKNFELLLRVFKNFHKSQRDYLLICVGMPFEKNEKDLINTLELSDSVLCVKANDKELSAYYAHAVAFIYPSLYEGFGMPILEAFAYGCPVILNNASCFPEIAGDSAIYFDGLNGSSLYDAMTDICNMSERERCSLVKSGYERLNMFSWAESAQRLTSIYKSLI